MKSRIANVVAGIGGILWLPLTVFGFGEISGFSSMINEPSTKIVDYFVSANVTRVYLGEYLKILGFVLLVVFATRLWAILRSHDGGSGWLSTLALGGVLLFVVLSLAGIAPLLAGTYRAAHNGMDTALYVALMDVRNVPTFMGFFVGALFLIPTGIVMVWTRAFPRWLGWIGIILGLLVMVGAVVPEEEIAFQASVLMGVWVLILGVILIAKAGAYSEP